MSQGEVLDLLEKKKMPMSIDQIAKLLGKERNSIGTNCRKLRKQGDIKIFKVKQPYNLMIIGLADWKEDVYSCLG